MCKISFHFLSSSVLILSLVGLLCGCGEEPQPIEPSGVELPRYEQAGTIGGSGGIVQVSDKDSTISGAFVEVPAGVLEENVTITIGVAQEGCSFEGDSTGIFVSLDPSGVEFEQPVKVGIPYKKSEASDVLGLNVYCYREDEFVWKPLPTVSVDTEKGVVVAETNHFSRFTVGDSHVEFSVELYRTRDNMISAHVRLATPLSRMPTDFVTMAATGALNVGELIETTPSDVRSYYMVTLKERKGFRYDWFDSDIKTEIIVYGIWDTPDNRYEVEAYRVKLPNNERDLLLKTSGKYLDLGGVQNYYSAEPLLFTFNDTAPDASKDYYVEVRLYYVNRFGWTRDSGGLWGNQGYYVSTRESSKRLDDIPSAPDRDGDRIIDKYDESAGNFPTATIRTPGDGYSFTEGVKITFSGTGTDPEDESLTGKSLVWSSDKDGRIGSGDSFGTSSLSANRHIITLTVTDSDGNASSESITVYVTSDNPPAARITDPRDGTSFTRGEPVTVSGSGVDAEDGALAGSSLVWTSSIDGRIGTGASLTASFLSAGEHEITLTATDSKGAKGAARITLIIRQEEEPPKLAVSPTFLDFGEFETSMNFTITNAGAGELKWTISEDEMYLGASSRSGDTSGDGTYSGAGDESITAIVGRIGLAENTYEGKISISSNGGNATVTVSFKVVREAKATNLMDGLVSYWSFDADARDVHGGYDGSVVGARHSTSDFKLGGGAYAFDGRGDFIDIGSPDRDFPSFDFTVSAWFKAPGSATNRGVLGKQTGGQIDGKGGFVLDLDERGGIYFHVGKDVSGPDPCIQFISDLGGFDDNNWRHVVVRVTHDSDGDGRMDKSDVEFWVNNTKQTGSYAELDDGALFTTAPFAKKYYIGNEEHGYCFNGILDEVAIWNRVLSEAEIQQLYNSGAGLAYPF